MGEDGLRGKQVRAKVERLDHMPKYRLALLRDDARSALREAGVVELPANRGDCEGGPRPCPLVRCKYNLFLDVEEKTGNIKFNYPDWQPEDMPEDASCALDVANRGGVQLKVVGGYMRITRERVRQIEERALLHLLAALKFQRREVEFREFLAALGEQDHDSPLASAEEQE